MAQSGLTPEEEKRLEELERLEKLEAESAKPKEEYKSERAKKLAEAIAKDKETPKTPRFSKQVVQPDEVSGLEATVENISDFGKGFLEGVIPFKTQLAAAGEAALSRPTDLKEWFEKYRQAEKINQQRYEEMMKTKEGGTNVSARAGEVAGMLFDPFASAASRGITALGGRAVKSIMGLSKEEKLLESAIKGGNPELIAEALERVRIKELKPTFLKTMAKEIPTGALMGGLYGASRSKGTSETLDKAFGYDRPLGEKGITDDVIESAELGALTGGILGGAGYGFSKIFGKASDKADALRAVAGKELESGERLGVPVNLEESVMLGKTFGPAEGPQLVYKQTEKVAKELTDRAVGSLQEAKDKLNDLITNIEGEPINHLASDSSKEFEQASLQLFNKKYNNYFKKYKRDPDPATHDQMWNNALQITARAALKKNYPELYTLLEHAKNPKIRAFINSFQKDFLSNLESGRALNYSTLFDLQKRMRAGYKKRADKLGLGTFERQMLFGKGDYKGEGIMYNQPSEFGDKAPGLMEQAIQRITPDVDEYRTLIKDHAAGPVETMLNENPEIAAQPLKAWNYNDPKIRNLLQKKFEALIELAGGTNWGAGVASQQLNDIYRVMLKAESKGKSGRELKKLADDILDLKQRVNESSQNTAALIGTVGTNQAQGHMKMEDMAQAYFDPKGMFSSLSTLNIGRAAGKAQATAKSIFPGTKLRDMSIDKLKEVARNLSRKDNAVISSIGKSAMQGLEENPMYKGVFLNQIAQNPELRKSMLENLPSEGDIRSAFMKFIGRSNLTPEEEERLKELEKLEGM